LDLTIYSALWQGPQTHSSKNALKEFEERRRSGREPRYGQPKKATGIVANLTYNHHVITDWLDKQGALRIGCDSRQCTYARPFARGGIHNSG